MKKTLLLVLLFVVPLVSAEQLVVNSQDWRDVYTGLQYASITDRNANFVVDAVQGADLAQRLGDDTDVLLITGDTQAMPGFRALIESRGYSVDEYVSRDAVATNYLFARRAQPDNIIVVDDAYGYNAVSVASYANRIGASVLFSSASVVDVIDDLDPAVLLTYGHIPGLIAEELSFYNPDVINSQDRFEDNFLLLQRYQREFPTESLVLSNGEFIEASLIGGDVPLLFIGRQNVPDDVIDFIRDNGFRSAVVVGNALAPNAVYIKEQTGIGVFIKFAQGRDSRQYALDLFQIPTPRPEVSIVQAEYDPASQSLLVTFNNPGSIATYFTASFSGESTFGGDTVVFLDAGTYKTISYPVEGVGDSLAYTLLFGAGPNSLDLILQGSVSVSEVLIDDQSEVSVLDAYYDTRRGVFMITLENTGPVDAYALLELVDVRIGQDSVRVGSEVVRVPQGSEVDVRVPADLSERDVERNSALSIELFYGQREFSLVHFSRVTRPFVAREAFVSSWMIGLAVLVAAILVWLVLRRRR